MKKFQGLVCMIMAVIIAVDLIMCCFCGWDVETLVKAIAEGMVLLLINNGVDYLTDK